MSKPPVIPKYEFTGETLLYEGVLLQQIVAIRDIYTHHDYMPANALVTVAGTVGGWIESESSLSHSGGCFVYDDAKVFNHSAVHHNACIRNEAVIANHSMIYDNAIVKDNARVDYHSSLCNYARATNKSLIKNHSHLSDCASATNNSIVNSAFLNYFADIGKDAYITSREDYLVIGNVGSELGIFTAYRTKDKTVKCTRGCFVGTLDEFLEEVKSTHGRNKYAKQYKAMIKYVRTMMPE